MVLFHGQNGFMHRIIVSLVLVLLCDAKAFLEKKGCGMPDLPAHSIYQCQPPLCQGPLDDGLFGSGTVLQFFCQPGYVLASQTALSICLEGQWIWVENVLCKPQGTPVAPPQNSLFVAASIPIIAGAALTLLAFLVTVQSCALLRLRPSVCHHHSGQYEILDTVEYVGDPDTACHLNRSVDSLPSYEDAVYGRLGNTLPPVDWGPRAQVASDEVLAQPEPHRVAGETPESPPPSYQESLGMRAESLPGGGWPGEATAQHLPRRAEMEDRP